jgi:hypothetical protein
MTYPERCCVEILFSDLAEGGLPYFAADAKTEVEALSLQRALATKLANVSDVRITAYNAQAAIIGVVKTASSVPRPKAGSFWRRLLRRAQPRPLR